uniref:Uncharacterized protein n=1 Tax=Strongyloides stercoralis TaxID=6248 RepID=A0A0K0EMF3_STRER
MTLKYLLFYIFIFFICIKRVYLCNTAPNFQPQLSLAPITRGISRMNSALMRSASLFKGEEYDEFEPIPDDPNEEEKNGVYFGNEAQPAIPEAEGEITTTPSNINNSMNITAFKDELEMINKTKNLINLFEEKARKLYENAEKNLKINNDKVKCNCSDFDLEDSSEIKQSSLNNKKVTTERQNLKSENSIKGMSEEEWELERKRQQLEDEKLIEERTKQFASEKMLSDSIHNTNGIDNEESSGIEDVEITSTTTTQKTTTTFSTTKILRRQVSRKYKTKSQCNDGYVIAITNKPYNELLIPIHRAEMSSELRQLENYVNRKLISWGQYTSYPMNYKGYFSQKYVMKNPKDCRGLEKFTKKAVSYGIFMEGGIFQCKCGSIKTIAKVH